MVSRKYDYTNESALEGRRKAGSREESPKGFPRLANAADPYVLLIEKSILGS